MSVRRVGAPQVNNTNEKIVVTCIIENEYRYRLLESRPRDGLVKKIIIW